VPGYNFQPWAFKVSMDTSLQVGDFLSTNRVGAEFTARPDNWIYVPVLVSAPLILYAVLTNPQMVNQLEPVLNIR
jgi:hypothetical protein